MCVFFSILKQFEKDENPSILSSSCVEERVGYSFS